MIAHEDIDSTSLDLTLKVDVGINAIGRHAKNINQQVNPEFLSILLLVIAPPGTFDKFFFQRSTNSLAFLYIPAMIAPSSVD